MIKTKELVYEYRLRDEQRNAVATQKALDGVNIKVKKGDFVAILGANGSGKSTFAKHLNALVRPSGGSIWVNGIDANERQNEFVIRSSAGMVFQNPDNQIVANVVEEDVGFGPENLAVPTEEILARVDESLQSVDIDQFRDMSPNKLSGGQKQRVTIAGVLAMHPECIILDEPTAMLDPSGRKKVLEVLKRINKEEKITIILITHYMEEVVDADYIYVMRKGKVVLEGAPREVFQNNEILEKSKLEVPVVNKLVKALRQQGLNIREDILDEDELIDEIKKICRR